MTDTDDTAQRLTDLETRLQEVEKELQNIRDSQSYYDKSALKDEILAIFEQAPTWRLNRMGVANQLGVEDSASKEYQRIAQCLKELARVGAIRVVNSDSAKPLYQARTLLR